MKELIVFMAVSSFLGDSNRAAERRFPSPGGLLFRVVGLQAIRLWLEIRRLSFQPVSIASERKFGCQLPDVLRSIAQRLRLSKH
jgi:hypothetical protein